MGLFRQLFLSGRRDEPNHSEPVKTTTAAVQNDDVTMTFNDKSVTYSGDLANYDYDKILKSKQKNIIRLFELSDYFVDADPIYRGIIKEVYTPFSIADNFKLVGADEKVKKKYLDYYKRINLQDKMASIFLQYYKYGNVYVYLMEDGRIITLPVHLIRIANIAIGGEPVLEMNCASIRNDFVQQGIKADKPFIKDEELDVRLRGFPKEVQKAVKDGDEYVQ